MKLEEKRRSFYFGLMAEKIAAIFLTCKLYNIIFHRYKCQFGEIDLIAKKGKKLVFIEIKARSDISLMDFITTKQQHRIIKAAEYFILCNPKYKNYLISFDVIIMNQFYWPKHLKNYW